MASCTNGDAESRPTGVPQPSATESASQEGQSESRLTIKASTFQVAYRLDGQVQKSIGVGIDVPAGTSLDPTAASGAAVVKGSTLGSLRVSAPSGPGEVGTVKASQRHLARGRVNDVLAPVDGIARLNSTSARVDAAGLDVIVPLKPLQELRYRGLNLAGAATVETVLGQRQSACVAVWLEALASPQDGSDAGSSAAVHCRLAADVETAAGLPAILTLTSIKQDGVVAIPLVYIGLDATGANFVVRVQKGAGFTERPVVVGATDGVRRVIAEGLKVGDVIVPVQPS